VRRCGREGEKKSKRKQRRNGALQKRRKQTLPNTSPTAIFRALFIRQPQRIAWAVPCFTLSAHLFVLLLHRPGTFRPMNLACWFPCPVLFICPNICFSTKKKYAQIFCSPIQLTNIFLFTQNRDHITKVVDPCQTRNCSIVFSVRTSQPGNHKISILRNTYQCFLGLQHRPRQLFSANDGSSKFPIRQPTRKLAMKNRSALRTCDHWRAPTLLTANMGFVWAVTLC